MPIVNSKIVRRDKAHHDGRDWKKRRHHREFREAKRDRWREKAHDHDGRAKLYRPRATPKYAYDAYGNYRVYDRGRRDGDWDRWDRWDGDRRDWDRRDWDRRAGRQQEAQAAAHLQDEQPGPPGTVAGVAGRPDGRAGLTGPAVHPCLHHCYYNGSCEYACLQVRRLNDED